MKRIIDFATPAAVVASALFAAPALATPGSAGYGPPTTVSNGAFGSLDVKADKSAKWDLLLKTKAATSVAVFRVPVAAGAHSGWHSHSAVSLITVTAGALTIYDGNNPLCTSRIVNAGQTFIDLGGDSVHLVHNASSTTAAEFIPVAIGPTGAPGRIDRPKPTNCPTIP